MEKMGKYLLNSKEIECKWQPTDNTKPIEMLKKRRGEPSNNSIFTKSRTSQII